MSEYEPAESESTAGRPSAADDRRRQLEFRRRRLFAQAQELFAVADYDGARGCLKRMSAEDRTGDVQRLSQLVTERLIEVAELRRELESARNGQAHAETLLKVRRLLELQPGDERAGALLHQLEGEEDGDGLFDESEPVVPPPIRRSRPDGNRGPNKPDGFPSRRRRRTPAREEAVLVEIVEDDVAGFEDEVWEFGAQLAASGPPPLRQSHREPYVDDFDDPVAGFASQAGVWIAVAVSGMVILLAVIVTVIVLVLEHG